MLFDFVNSFVVWARDLGSYKSISEFLSGELLIIDFLLLAIGFIVLLIEIRLPLKQYWRLPKYLLTGMLRGIRLFPQQKVWGTVVDDETNKKISLAAIELIDRSSLSVIDYTFSNRDGEFGFNAKKGNYFVRAIKNHYSMPSFIDPENIELLAVDESSVIPVEIQGDEPPSITMHLLRVTTIDNSSLVFFLQHYLKTFVITASNLSLFLSAIASYFAWVVGKSPVYGILIAVDLLLLFVKIYILESVGRAASIDTKK